MSVSTVLDIVDTFTGGWLKTVEDDVDAPPMKVLPAI